MSVASVCHTLLGKGVTVVEGNLDGKIAVFAVIVELAKIFDNIALAKVAFSLNERVTVTSSAILE